MKKVVEELKKLGVDVIQFKAKYYVATDISLSIAVLQLLVANGVELEAPTCLGKKNITSYWSSTYFRLIKAKNCIAFAETLIKT